MGKFCISVDSVADISAELLSYLGVKIIPFKVRLGKGVISDKMVTADELASISNAAKNAEIFAIVPPTREEYEEFFDNLAENHTDIIHICQGSYFSRASLNALYAAKNTMTKYYGSTVYVIDGRATSAGLAMIAEYAVNLQNKGYSADDAFVQLSEMPLKIEQYAVTRDLILFNNAYPSGMGKMVLASGSTAVISVDDIGKPTTYKRASSTSSAVSVIAARYQGLKSPSTALVYGSSDIPLLLKTVAMLRKKNALDLQMSSMGLCNSLLFGKGSVFVSFLGKPPKSRVKPVFNPGKESDIFSPDEE